MNRETPLARGLAADLRRRVHGEVRFSDGDRALFALDGSNYRHIPIGVVIPYTVEALAEAVAVCAEHGAPILHRGAGTSLAGQTTNTAVVIDSSKYCTGILEIDPERRIARVEPGVVLDELRAAAGRHGLTFGPDPSTHGWCTLGGMIGNNAGGVHSVTAGLTVDNVEELEVLTYDGVRMTVGPTDEAELSRIIEAGGRRGQIYAGLGEIRDRYGGLVRERYAEIPRRVSGYPLDQLLPEKGFHVARALVGSEGTCVTILRATVRLVPDPACKVLLVIGYDSIFDAADAVPLARAHGAIGIEGVDDRLVADMRRKHLHEESVEILPDGKSWLLVQFGAPSRDAAVEKARGLVAAIEGRPHVADAKLIVDERQRQRIWEVREAGLPATAFIRDLDRDTWEGWEDSAVAPEDLGRYLRDLERLYRTYGYTGARYGHFGDGLVHTRIDFGLRTPEQVDRFRRFLFDAARLVARYRGSLSGEHGDGQARSELLPILYGDELVHAFERFKAIWDPSRRMNPGRIVHAPRVDADLRFGPDFRPPQVETVFSFRDEDHSFVRAAMRCVGVGKCRRHGGGTMCPSFRATHEEKHTTRGRARLLQEMLQGDPVRDGWRSDAVREALDLCLSCKGCKSDCPVNVDMATYKAEFLHHYYDGRWRPRAAYALGEIHRWSRALAPVARLANIGTQLPGLDSLAKLVAGIHPDRRVPPFATRTFRKGWRPSSRDGADGPLVVLWPDTFNDHFTPGPLFAAAEVLEAAGCRVELPRRNLCCGRPCYDYGRLDQAKAILEDTMAGLGEQLARGAYVVGVEPSCMATFRDELPNLFPGDPTAELLCERSMMLSEFLDKVIRFEPPRIARKAVLRGHCNHKAIFGLGSDEAILRKAARQVEVLDDGCCGMAGAFGYETHKYPVSLRIAEDVTLPAVRAADPDTLIVCDGYSCREQILHGTGRRVLTLAEVLQRALREGEGASFPQTDRRYEEARREAAVLAGVVGLAAGAAALWWSRRGRAQP